MVRCAKNFTKVGYKSEKSHVLVGLAAGTLMATALGSELLAAERLPNEKALLQLKAVAGKKEAIEAYENLKVLT